MSFANKRPGGRIMPARRLTSQVDPEKQFEKIALAISEIYKHNASKLSFEELYRTAYGLVLSKNGPLLYEGVKRVLETHLTERMHQDILEHVLKFNTLREAAQGEALLSSIRLLWSEHVTAMLMIKDVLMYVDKVYVKTAQLPSIYDMGMRVFRDQVLLTADQQVLKALNKAILNQIQDERKQLRDANRHMLRSVIGMLIELQDPAYPHTLYQSTFELRLHAMAGAHYLHHAQRRIEHMGAPEYVRTAQADLDAEMDRVDAYLAPSSAPKLRKEVLEKLISDYSTRILVIPGAGLAQMLDQRDIPSLGVLYKLYVQLPEALKELKDGTHNHILALGKESMASTALTTTGPSDGANKGDTPKSPVSGLDASGTAAKTAVALRWVQEILSLYDIYDEFLQKAFEENQSMRNAIKDAFIEVINANSRAPELLSLFIDENLKNGLRRMTEQEMDHILERSVLMFRFLKNKDAFEHYYKAHLAKRLLLGRSVSDDAEQSVVSKLKVECGSQFTLKLEGMFKDMQLSSDLTRELRESSMAADLGFDVNVSVLTPTFWPTTLSSDTLPADALSSSSSVILPSAGGVSKAIDTFSAFYLKCHSGRRLTWQYSMGSADLKVHFGTRTHELNVSTFQMLILMLFVDGAENTQLTMTDIRERTQIPEDALTRHLQSLACGKFRVLTKTPMSRDVKPTDVFSFNNGFKSPQYRIRIPVVSARNNLETEKEKTASLAAIGQERQYLIEAAVVRIMKTRRRMTHEQLVNETIDQLSSRFMAPPKIIKEGIGKLIDRDYLQRSPEDPRIYIYLA
ncbi:hypothetical protein LPJ66_004249 [Kickxella alabastrina]|uniref:Uncharacterized protein n=1 Tax=Kickxella alabastrina TaxID=61397 RepID=A0ACC1IK53_9FUNG|nr:hypothetical protein LPJ66_004249 [Kickxella alabastrina]